MLHRLLPLLVACAVLATGSACDSLVDPSDNVTTEFSGTVEPGSGAEHTIRMTRNGEYTLRVKSLTPSQGTLLLVQFGLVDQVFCALLAQNFVGHNQFALAGEIRDLEYCITVEDPGVLTEPTQYVLEFSHPPID
jgi:hypothetical protein